MLPKDPILLLSVVNTKLRDNYPSLDELCHAEDADPQEIIQTLDAVGYVYQPDLNQFR